MIDTAIHRLFKGHNVVVSHFISIITVITVTRVLDERIIQGITKSKSIRDPNRSTIRLHPYMYHRIYSSEFYRSRYGGE